MSAEEINADLVTQLRKTLEEGLDENAVKAFRKKIDDLIASIDDDITYRLKDDLAVNLQSYVMDMVTRTINAIIEGNEREVRRYLHCEQGHPYNFTGRSTGYVGANRRIEDQHPVIHGKLHEGMYVDLRRKMFEAHRDLVTSERVLDLEDQVKSLVAQVNKANAEREAMWERVRALS